AINNTPMRGSDMREAVPMHVLGERLHVLDGGCRQNAVTEIENVARSSAGTLQHIVGRGEHAIERREQKRGIEIALDRAVVSDTVPGFVERNPPVGANDVAARGALIGKNR